MNIAKFVLRLRDLISSAFPEPELIMALYPEGEFFDYTKQVEGTTYLVRIFNTILAYEQRQGADGVLRLAKICAQERQLLAEFQQFVADLEAAMGAANGAPVPDFMRTVLAQLESFIQDATINKRDLHELADTVRPTIRQPGVDSAVVADAFHLGSASYQRLAAVLALEHGHRPQYQHWLAERIIVESPIAAMYAAQALTVSALKAPRTEESLNSLKKILKQASHQLDNLLEDEDDPQLQASRRPVDITTRKRQVLAALSILELRTRRNPPPQQLTAEEFDQLARALIDCFTKEELNNVLKEGIGMPLNRLVPVTDTFEQIVSHVLLTACESGWVGELAFSVDQAHADRPACKLPFAARFAPLIV